MIRFRVTILIVIVFIVVCRGGFKTAATSKMKHFVIIVNRYYHKELHLECCSSPRSASGYVNVKEKVCIKNWGSKFYLFLIILNRKSVKKEKVKFLKDGETYLGGHFSSFSVTTYNSLKLYKKTLPRVFSGKFGKIFQISFSMEQRWRVTINKSTYYRSFSDLFSWISPSPCNLIGS